MSSDDDANDSSSKPLKQKKLTMLTRSKFFKSLCKWAFGVCDHDNTGQINKTELYTGIVLVHLQLAKYVGAAACYPPTRAVCDKLFDASDDDNSGFVDEQEFAQIVVICCAQISSRILVYFLIIILLVPYVAEFIVWAFFQIDNVLDSKISAPLHPFKWIEAVLSVGDIAQKVVSTALFFFVVPMFFNYIDFHTERVGKEMDMKTEKDNADSKTSKAD